jgi:SAM-dependent methyltransferase
VTSYALANASPHGNPHLNGLSGMFDPFTAARINESSTLAGARCLELGAGNGSVAIWLAEQVGPDGHVTATDLDVRRIPDHDRVSVVSHDLLKDPVPDGPFDLIHARLLLGHLPNRDALLEELTARLAPGGTILIEDFNTTGAGRTTAVLHAPSQPPGVADLWNEYEALRHEQFAAAGTDGSFIIGVHGLLVDAGLTDVQTVTYCQSWRGGDPGSRHALGTLQQFRPKLATRGFGDYAVDTLVEALDDPDFHVAGRLLCSTSGTAA